MSRGRDKYLISRRDEKLLIRFHYWTEEKHLRTDYALRVLSDEFFLSEERMLKIIRKGGYTAPATPPSQPRAPGRVKSVPAQLQLFKGE